MQYVNEVYGVFTAYTSLSPDCPEYRSKDPVTQGQSSFRLLVIAPGWIDYFAWYPDDLSFVSNRRISSTTSPWYNVHEKWAWHVGFHWFHFPRSFLHVDCLCTIFVQCILVFFSGISLVSLLQRMSEAESSSELKSNVADDAKSNK